MKTLKYKILIVLTLLSINGLWAQKEGATVKSEKKLTQYSISNWSVEDGLPSSALNSIYQTNDGYLWITSYQGIIRFDGFDFDVFTKENTPQLPSNSFFSMEEGTDSTLWFTNENNEVAAYKNGKFITDPKVEQLKKSLELKLSGRPNHFRFLSFNRENFFYENNRFHFPTFDTILTNIEPNTSLLSDDGTMYFGTSRGLIIYTKDTLKIFNTKNGMSNEYIYSLWMDHQNRLWIATQSGLLFFDGKTFTEDPDYKNTGIRRIVYDGKDHVWLGTKKGLYKKNLITGQTDRLTMENGLPSNHITNIYFDTEGNIWLIPLRGGLTQLKNEKFTVYDNKSGLKGRSVNTVCEVNPNEFLIAFDNGNIQKIKPNSIEDVALKYGLKGKRVRHIFKDSKDNLWIATYGGLLKQDKQGKEEWLSAENGFPSSLIRLIYEDKQGQIWIGTRDMGLIKYNADGNYQIIDINKGLNANLVMSIDEDAEGHLLVCTAGGGLQKFAQDSILHSYTKESGLLSNVIFNTYTDAEGAIWIASNAGLSRIKNNIITNFEQCTGLSSDCPFDIIEDEQGYLWMPFPLGLMKAKKASLDDFADKKSKTIDCRVFDKYDGVPPEGFTPVAQSQTASDKTIWIPALNGIMIVDPLHNEDNTHQAQVHIEAFIADNDTIDLTKKNQFISNKNRLSFYFNAICFQAPEKIRFKYKLKGYDTDWKEVGADQRFVSYTNLPYGEFTFQVQASNNDGLWNTVGDEISFYIKPLWHETTLFYIMAIVLSLATLYLFYKIRIYQLKKRHTALENIISERTAEIRNQNEQLEEINAAKDKLFHIIAHDLRSPFNTILGMSEMLMHDLKEFDTEEISQFMASINASGKKAFELLENLLEWAGAQSGSMVFNPEHFHIAELTDETIDLFHINAKTKNIRITHDIPQNMDVYADRNMLKTILRNLLSNAVKFTAENGEIHIHAIQKEKHIEISVQDNGMGISSELKNKILNLSQKITTKGTNKETGTGLGLLLCKDFVKMHNGHIWLHSEEMKGTTFFISLPNENKKPQ